MLSCHPPFPRLCLVLCLAAACTEAFAGEADLRLKPSNGLTFTLSKEKPLQGPTFLEADHVQGYSDTGVEASGHVVIQNLRERLEAEKLRYDTVSDEAHAEGKIVFQHNQGRLEGQALKLKLEARLGEMHTVRYELHAPQMQNQPRDKTAHGSATALHFQGPDRYQLDQATYTTCPLNNEDWVLRTEELALDYNTSLGTARRVRVDYLGTPILYIPWMDFSLDDKRKSGFLAPSYGASSDRGLELLAPWYWNIAPNRDATFYPRLMTKRGLQLGGELRYLDDDFKGHATLEYLSNDRIAHDNRHLGIWQHQQRFDKHWSLALDLEKASDDAYFVDLSNQVNQTSQVHLPRQLEINYNRDWLNAKGVVQEFQTLQDPAAIIFEPYRRLPQLVLTAGRDKEQSGLLQWDVASEFVAFDRRDNDGVQGHRLHINPTLSYPVRTAAATITPKLGWFFSHYDLDDNTLALRDSQSLPTAGSFASTRRNMPMFSIDTSLLLEKDDTYFGKGFIQTLEPRLYYLYIPYRDQSRIPVFDTGIGDLSMDQLFSENQYLGIDRINDANQLTLAVTSRFLETGSGMERISVTLGQRYYFSDQHVTFPGQTARAANSTDLLALVSGQLNDRLRLSTGLQFNTADGELARANFGGSWRNGPGQIFNADYRYINKRYATSLNQIDLSTQWPLKPQWYGVSRINYSLEDDRLVEGLLGVEYNAGCWSLRGMMQRLVTTQDKENNAFFLQLELRGLTKLGPNPLDILKRSISGYAKSDEIDQP